MSTFVGAEGGAAVTAKTRRQLPGLRLNDAQHPVPLLQQVLNVLDPAAATSSVLN